MPTSESAVGGVGGSSVELLGTIPLVQIGGYLDRVADDRCDAETAETELGHSAPGCSRVST